MARALLSLAVTAAAVHAAQVPVRLAVVTDASAAVTPADAALTRVKAGAAVRHVYNHLLGLPAPTAPHAQYEAASVAGLPSSPLFTRPTAAWFFMLEADASTPLASLVPTSNAAVTLDTNDAGVAPALLRTADRRHGFNAFSVEVLASRNAARHASGEVLVWDEQLGFLAQGTRDLVVADMLGVTACTPAGAAALSTLGVTVNFEGSAHCVSASLPGVATPLSLRTASAGARALSELAALTLLARRTATEVSRHATASSEEVAAQPIVHRVALRGLAAVARSEPAAAAAAMTQLYARALTAARDTLVAAADAQTQSIVSLIAALPASAFEHVQTAYAIPAPVAAARSLQTNGSAASTGGVVYSMEEIANYQMCLWTGVLLVGSLLVTLYFLLGMDEKKDPALYSEVVDTRASGRTA